MSFGENKIKWLQVWRNDKSSRSQATIYWSKNTQIWDIGDYALPSKKWASKQLDCSEKSIPIVVIN